MDVENNMNFLNNSEQVKHLRRDFNLYKENKTKDNMLPKTWKKYGEVYSNANGECVFVCDTCLDFELIYSTCDASAFWSHIQQQHISVDCEIVDEEPPAKKIHTEIDNNLEKNVESAQINAIDGVEEPIKLLEMFHESLVCNFGTSSEIQNKSDDKQETQQEEIKTENETYSNEIKMEAESLTKEEFASDLCNKLKLENSLQNADSFDNGVQYKNYSYNNDEGVYTISDDEDENEDDDDDGHYLLSAVKEQSASGYLVHNDMIVLSDEEHEDEEDKIKTRPNSPQLIETHNKNTQKERVEETNNALNAGYNYSCSSCRLIFPDCNKLIDHMTTHEIEEVANKDAPTNFNTTDPVNCIPTPEVSPNFGVDNQNSQTYQCNNCPQRFFEIWQLERHQRAHLSKQKVQKKYKSRPFQCNTCGKRTITEKAMINHQKRFHSPDADRNDLTTECEICHKRIRNMHQHMDTHSDTRYQCTYCNLSYKHRQTLQIHVKKFHTHATNNTSTQSLQQPITPPITSPYPSFPNNTQPSNLSTQEHLHNTRLTGEHGRLTPEEQAMMYSFFLHCQSQNKNNNHPDTAAPSGHDSNLI